MKKLLILLLLFSFILTGCTSTNPALTDVLFKNMQMLKGSYESTHNITFSTNLFSVMDEEIPEDAQLVLDVLEQGITVDYKQKDQQNMYIKLSTSSNVTDDAHHDFEIETHVIDLDTYFKTNLEEDFIHMDLFEEYIEDSPEIVDERLTKFHHAIQQYLKQYDYKLEEIEFVGREAVETPAGSIQANHIQVQMDLDEIFDMLAYTYGNVADYEHLRELFIAQIELYRNQDIEELMSEEEIDSEVYFTRADLKRSQVDYKEMDLDEMAAWWGVRPELDLKLDFYVKNNGELVQQKLHAHLVLEPVETEDGYPIIEAEEPISFTLTQDSKFWNVGKEITYELPNLDQTMSWTALITDYQEHKKLHKDSLIRWYLEEMVFERYGRFYLDEDYAFINGEFIDLNPPLYNKNGNTMIPVVYMADLTYGDLKFNGKNKEVTIISDETSITLKIGSTTAIVNGEEVEMPIAAEIIDGRTYVPLKFIVEQLGAEVEWDHDLKAIYIEF